MCSVKQSVHAVLRVRACTRHDKHTQYPCICSTESYSIILVRVNLHGSLQHVSRVLTTHLAAAHLRSDSSLSHLFFLSLRVLSSFRPLDFTVCTSFVLLLPCSHTSACRTQSLGFCPRALPPSFPFLLLLFLSTPFSLPHSLPKAGSSDPCKCLNTESFPFFGRG